MIAHAVAIVGFVWMGVAWVRFILHVNMMREGRVESAQVLALRIWTPDPFSPQVGPPGVDVVSPSAASRTAVALPMPAAAPVTIAFIFSNRIRRVSRIVPPWITVSMNI